MAADVHPAGRHDLSLDIGGDRRARGVLGRGDARRSPEDLNRRARTGAMLALGALALDVTACFALTGALGARNDLYPRWLATRLWLTAGQDLYSPETDAAIGAAIGASPIGGETFVFGFVYPAYVALLL